MTSTAFDRSVQDTLERYHVALDTRDGELLLSTLAEDVVLRSPITARVPFAGKAAVRTVAETVLAAADGMRSTVVGGGRTGLIRFGMSVRGVELDGVDVLEFDDEARITEITVFIRPLPGLVALMAAIAPDIARGRGHPVLARLLRPMIEPLLALVRAVDRFLAPLVLRPRRQNR